MSLGIKMRTPQIRKLNVIEESSPLTTSVADELEQDKLEDRCTQALLTIISQFRQVINHNREGENIPLTVQQYAVLLALKEQKRLISELADILKVSRPTMSRIIDGLEGRKRPATLCDDISRPKLVIRVASEDDHRLVYAHITEEGLTVLDQYGVQVKESITTILRQVPPEELLQISYSLETLARAVVSEL